MQLKNSKFHFVGVGGIGMCGLAELLHNMGAIVSGSDIGENANTERLASLGIKIMKGHSAQHVLDPDVLVYSSAVKMDNPELLAARQKKIPLIPRAEALAEIMHLQRGLAVAGSHGKTTTTSMLASVFLHAQLEPTIVIGGRFDLIQSTARLGAGEWMLAEADESDGSFHKLSPEIAIITNIDNDHLDHFKSLDNLYSAFYQFALRIPFYGTAIVCFDDPAVRRLFAEFPKKLISYGFSSECQYRLQGEQGSYQLFHKDQLLGEFSLKVPGKHNALNAAAAILAGLEAGLDFPTCSRGLGLFVGVDRRFHFRGEAKGVKVYDDYGHHPTEIAATLQAFRERYPQHRLVVLFQPHRYSRTQNCWNEFLNCFSLSDEVFITDIYSAGEEALANISSERLASSLNHKLASYLPKNSKLAETLVAKLRPGSVLIVFGAGDIWKQAELALDVLRDVEVKS